MQTCDRATSERFGVASIDLMRAAAAAVAAFARRQFPQAQRVTVLCGTGNNGGDGMMAARLLAHAGLDVATLLVSRTPVTWGQLAEVARAIRDLITDIGLTTLPLTSGSKGLHLYTPLDEPVSSRGATVLAKRVAQQLEKAMPKLVTSTMTKSLRAGKVFLDWSQNSGSKTTIAPYSLRGR